MTKKAQIVSSLLVLLMLLTKVTINLETQTQDSNTIAALTTELNKKFDNGSEEDCSILLSKLNILKERLKKVLECDESLPELKLLKEELTTLVGKEQCLFEATRLAEELVLQKNANRSLGQVLKMTDAAYKQIEAENARLKSVLDRPQSEGLGLMPEVGETREEGVLQSVMKNFEVQQRIAEVEQKKLEEENKQLKSAQRLLAEQLLVQERRVEEGLVEQRLLAEQLLLKQRRVEEGTNIIRQCQDDIANDTRAYNILEAEAKYYKQRGDYYKGLCEEADILTIEWEKRSMSMEDKREQREHGLSPLDEKYMRYTNSHAELEKIKRNTYGYGSTQIKEIKAPKEIEDPELQEALRLSQEEIKAPKEEIDPELQEAIRLSQEDHCVDTLKPQDYEDPELQEAIRLSNQC